MGLRWRSSGCTGFDRAVVSLLVGSAGRFFLLPSALHGRLASVSMPLEMSA